VVLPIFQIKNGLAPFISRDRQQDTPGSVSLYLAKRERMNITANYENDFHAVFTTYDLETEAII